MSFMLTDDLMETTNTNVACSLSLAGKHNIKYDVPRQSQYPSLTRRGNEEK